MAESPPVPVPVALNYAAAAWRRDPTPQSAFPWSRRSWGAYFPSHGELLESLPDRIDRRAATEQARDADKPESAIGAFIVAMIWGYGTVGYGPWRTQRILEANEDVAPRLAEVTRVARQEGALAGFDAMSQRPLKHLGVAFGTKYLYFCTADSPAQAAGSTPMVAPVLDRIVRRWLRDHADIRVRIDRWRTDDYRRYLDALGDWAEQLELPIDTVEELIFRSVRAGGSELRQAVEIRDADEGGVAQWSEAGRDAFEALLELDEALDELPGGTAGDEAQDHLDAIRSIIEQHVQDS